MVGYGQLNTPMNVKEGSGSKSLLFITEPDDEPQCAQWERGDLEMLVTKIMQIAS